MAAQEVNFVSNFGWDEDVLDGIFIRKELILHRFRITQQREDSKASSLITIYEMSPKKILESLENAQTKAEVPMEFFSRKPPLVVFRAGKNKQQTCDFICIEYARFQQISANRDSILRYTYFELYFENCIVSCLADMATLRSTGGFSALDLDAAGWAAAKQQMLYWNKIFYPDLEMLSKPPRMLTPALCDRFVYWEENASQRDDSHNIFEMYNRELTCYRVDDNVVWPMVTYLSLIQLLPILPRKLIPAFQINYVCEETILNDFTEKLSYFLTAFYEADPVIGGDIVSVEVPLPDKGVLRGAGVPYILRAGKNTKTQNLIKEISAFAAMPKREWTKHPYLNQVPIMVSTEESQDSVVMNIPVGKEDLQAEWYDGNELYSKMAEVFATLAFKSLGKGKKGKNSIKNRFSELAKELKPSDEQFELLNSDRREFKLAVFFSLLFFTGYDVRVESAISYAKEWVETLEPKWAAAAATVEDAVDYILKMAAGDAKTAHKDTPPNNMAAEERGSPFIWENSKTRKKRESDGEMVADEICLCYPQKTFEAICKKKFRSLPINDLLGALKRQGYIKTNKTGSSKYYHGIRSVDGQMICYSFFLDKLSEVEID